MLTINDIRPDGFGFYSDIGTKDTILECWGASTKHPDCAYRFSSYTDKCEWLSDFDLIYQWLLYCASKMSFPFHSYCLVEFTNEYYNTLKR